MKTRTKKLLGVVGIVATLGVLTSCNSFCSSYDSASFRYQHDPINTRFFSNEESAKKYAFEDIQSNNKKHKDELTLDNEGKKPLTLETVNELKVDVFNTETGKKTLESIITKASDVFHFEGTTNAFNLINAALENTYIVKKWSY